MAEEVEGGMRLEALYALVVEGEDGPPHRLHDGAVVLEDALEPRHDLAPRIDVERALGLGEELVELGIGVLGLVPRSPGAICQSQAHDPERAMCPRREAERHLGPD